MEIQRLLLVTCASILNGHGAAFQAALARTPSASRLSGAARLPVRWAGSGVYLRSLSRASDARLRNCRAMKTALNGRSAARVMTPIKGSQMINSSHIGG